MRPIDADLFFSNYPELAIEPYINAPTIETKTIAECIIAYGDGYESARRLYERPQGEWVDYNAYYKTCSFCKRTVGFDFLIQSYENPIESYNFCPNCGAAMEIVKHE